jgi:hypothetical protein
MRARFLALIFILLIQSAAAPADEKQGEKPDEASCRALYLKRIGQLAADSLDPASIGIREHRPALQSDATVKAAAAHCQGTMSVRQVQCGLDSSACDRETQKVPGSDTAKTDETPGQTATPEEPPETQPARENPPATAEECRKVYDHLLSVYATDDVKKKPGGEKLLENWRSPVARQSFQARCEKVFHREDAQCILSSRDPDIARACLLVIPE